MVWDARPQELVSVLDGWIGIPHGTRVPEGTPPSEDRPLVPPFPAVACDDPVKLLERYESMHESSTMPTVDKAWKPTCERVHEPSPCEARTFWLEKEVATLRSTFASFANGNSMKNSEYWNGRFQRSTNGDHVQSRIGPALPWGQLFGAT